MQLSPDAVNHFFGWILWVAFIAVLIIAYFATRKSSRPHRAPIGRTYSCAQCGRRGTHEHMVPVNHSGSVVWYCTKHAAGTPAGLKSEPPR